MTPLDSDWQQLALNNWPIIHSIPTYRGKFPFQLLAKARTRTLEKVAFPSETCRHLLKADMTDVLGRVLLQLETDILSDDSVVVPRYRAVSADQAGNDSPVYSPEI